MDSKKNTICGGMGLGYGSKYQLLRMLGWHRNWFNDKVCGSIDIQGLINWYDFSFNGVEDKELLNASFLDEVIKKEWEKVWPTNVGRNGINWDAVGKLDSTIILVEAKAHLDECDAGQVGGGSNPKKAIESIKRFQNKYGITECDWLQKKVYQLANRLVFTDFLLEHGIDTKLVYVLFTNGFEFNTTDGKSKSVKTAEQWIEKMDLLMKNMGVKGTDAERLLNICVIDCNPPKK